MPLRLILPRHYAYRFAAATPPLSTLYVTMRLLLLPIVDADYYCR